MHQARQADPLFVRIQKAENALGEVPWRKLKGPRPSSHLWKAKLPQDLQPGAYLLHVKATDHQGSVVHGYRVLRVKK